MDWGVNSTMMRDCDLIVELCFGLARKVLWEDSSLLLQPGKVQLYTLTQIVEQGPRMCQSTPWDGHAAVEVANNEPKRESLLL